LSKSVVKDSLFVVKESTINLLRRKFDIESTAYIFSDSHLQDLNIVVFNHRTDREYFDNLRKLGQTCVKSKANYMILVTDRYIMDVAPKDLDYVMKNIQTESPELYPEEMRKNALIFQCLNFRNGKELTTDYWLYRKANGNIEHFDDLHFDGIDEATLKYVRDGILDILDKSDSFVKSSFQFDNFHFN
jgi:hypothetical protein